MATQPRYLYGDPCRVQSDFDTASTIGFTTGDFVLQNAATIGLAGTSTVVTNFLGLVAQARPSGSTTGTALRLMGNSTDGKIGVDTSGIWEVDRSDTIALNIGDPMGLDGTTANTLKKVGDESIALAFVVEKAATSSARCVVRIMSRKAPLAPKS